MTRENCVTWPVPKFTFELTTLVQTDYTSAVHIGQRVCEMDATGGHCRNETMREDARDDIGARHALMKTYVDDPVQPGENDPDTAAGTSGTAGSEGGGGMPKVV